MTNNEVGIDFFVSPDTNLQRRVVASDIKVSSGNQMVVRDLSGEHYQHLDLTIQPGSNTVIIGDNVAARQELVHDLAHAREIEGSKLQLPKDARIEFVSPTITNIGDDSVSIRDFFLEARGIAGMEARLTALWTAGVDDPKALDEAGKLQQQFETAGGWEADREIELLLQGLRVGTHEHDHISLETPLNEMSSGQISKAIIGRALFSQAGIIIMDDPSVHLDVDSKRWLADYIHSSQQATIIATSDMSFAEEIGDRVIEILNSKLILNIGTDVNNFYSERKKLIDFWVQEAEQAKSDIDDLAIQIRDFFRPAGRQTDNMAQVLRAQESKLARMQADYDQMPGKLLIEARQREPQTRVFSERQRSGKNVFRLYGVDILYVNDDNQESTVIEIPDLAIDRSDRLAIIGSNGSGKSTLLKVLGGHTDDMMVEGDFKHGASVTTGYYSPYTELAHPDTPLRVTLAQYANDPMGILSYWGFDKSQNYDTKPEDLHYRDEIARAQFALLMAQRPNVLILDEPTSYLTPNFQKRLLHAVQGYDGTLLMVSHDPYFLSKARLSGRIVMPGAVRQMLQ